MLPLSPGRAERHGFEYYRHGTLSLYAAFNTKTGEVLGKTATRHTSAEFVAFLTDIVINLTWAGSGVQWSNRYSGNSKCLDYSATFHSTFDYEFSTATGTIGNDAASDPLAQVAHSTQTSNVNITVPAACNPYGF